MNMNVIYAALMFVVTMSSGNASAQQLPDFKDYSMKGRTYRYMNDALFPFGSGLSYTSFRMGDAALSNSILKKGEKITLKVPASNVGKKDGTEIVQVYVKDPADADGPLKTLKAFERVEVKAGKTAKAVITLDKQKLRTLRCCNQYRSCQGWKV